ncbi:hypothetical protein GQ53DRAFT_820040 [Thozetella sp. PMI_491]|nr:hypothetical protein GQ53DRAFT_820040 [Thozetella sp. PMI_491]
MAQAPLLHGGFDFSPVVSPAVMATTTIDLFLGRHPTRVPSVYASVLSADALKTTYYLSCAPGFGFTDDSCSMIGAATVTVEPTLVELHVTKETTAIVHQGPETLTRLSTTTGSLTCPVTTGAARCTGALVSHISQELLVEGTVYFDDWIFSTKPYLIPVTVTGGLEKLPQAEPTTTGVSTSTGGAPKITQKAILAGVAAMAGGVMVA